MDSYNTPGIPSINSVQKSNVFLANNTMSISAHAIVLHRLQVK